MEPPVISCFLQSNAGCLHEFVLGSSACKFGRWLHCSCLAEHDDSQDDQCDVEAQVIQCGIVPALFCGHVKVNSWPVFEVVMQSFAALAPVTACAATPGIRACTCPVCESDRNNMNP